MNLPPELQAALLGRRMVFLRGKLDDAAASNVAAQLLLVGRMAEARPVEVYIDSPGGTLAAALTVYDVLQSLKAPVSTTCAGTADGAAVLVLAGGAPGRRFALPHARIHLSEEQVDLAATTGRQVPNEAAEAARIRARWRTALVQHSAHSAERLDRDLAAGRWLSAAEARDYGLVDGIIPGRG